MPKFWQFDNIAKILAGFLMYLLKFGKKLNGCTYWATLPKKCYRLKWHQFEQALNFNNGLKHRVNNEVLGLVAMLKIFFYRRIIYMHTHTLGYCVSVFRKFLLPVINIFLIMSGYKYLIFYNIISQNLKLWPSIISTT